LILGIKNIGSLHFGNKDDLVTRAKYHGPVLITHVMIVKPLKKALPRYWEMLLWAKS
jgi:hypothetical protein